MRYRQHSIDDDGWTEWVQPRHARFLLKCCDCDLVHEMQFRVVQDDGAPYVLLSPEIEGARVLFRARRLRSQEKRRQKAEKRAKAEKHAKTAGCVK